MNKLTKKKLLFITLALLIANLLLTILLSNLDGSTYQNLDGTPIEPHSSELVGKVIFGQLVSLPIFAILIGLLVAIFIDKELPYPKRIVRSSLLTLTTIYGLYAVMGFVRVVLLLYSGAQMASR